MDLSDISQKTIDDIARKAIDAYDVLRDPNNFDTNYDRLCHVKNEFDEIIDYVRENDELYSEAEQYVLKRNALNGILEPLQNEIIDTLIKILEKNHEVIAASSFTAQTYLIGESDLDINFLVDNLYFLDLIKITKDLKNLGYEFIENRGFGESMRHVFGKNVLTEAGQVDVEIKVRDLKYFASKIQGVHEYLDNEVNERDRSSITLIKYILSVNKDKKGYSEFKALYYEWANYQYQTSILGKKINDSFDMMYQI